MKRLFVFLTCLIMSLEFAWAERSASATVSLDDAIAVLDEQAQNIHEESPTSIGKAIRTATALSALAGTLVIIPVSWMNYYFYQVYQEDPALQWTHVAFGSTLLVVNYLAYFSGPKIVIGLSKRSYRSTQAAHLYDDRLDIRNEFNRLYENWHSDLIDTFAEIRRGTLLADHLVALELNSIPKKFDQIQSLQRKVLAMMLELGLSRRKAAQMKAAINYHSVSALRDYLTAIKSQIELGIPIGLDQGYQSHCNIQLARLSRDRLKVPLIP